MLSLYGMDRACGVDGSRRMMMVMVHYCTCCSMCGEADGESFLSLALSLLHAMSR